MRHPGSNGPPGDAGPDSHEVTFRYSRIAELVQALTDAQGFLNHFYSREPHGIEEDDLNEERKKLLARWRQELKMGAYPWEPGNDPPGESGDPGDLTPCQPGLPAWPCEPPGSEAPPSAP